MASVPPVSPSASGTTVSSTTVANDQNTRKFESYRKMGSIAGKIQLPFALLGLALTFGYVNSALAIASASIALENWKSEQNARAHFVNGSRSGCDAIHLKGVCIAGIVFALIEGVALALAWPAGLVYIAVAEVIRGGALDGSGAALDDTLRWVGISILLTPFLCALQLVLFSIQIISYDSMRRSMPPMMVFSTSAVPQGMVAAYVPQAAMQPHMVYAMPQQGMQQYPAGQPMPQGQYGPGYPSYPPAHQQPMPAYGQGWAPQGQGQAPPPSPGMAAPPGMQVQQQPYTSHLPPPKTLD